MYRKLKRTLAIEFIAGARGTLVSGEDGRWGTAWRACLVQQLDFGDAPEGPYPTLLGTNGTRRTI